MVVGFSEPGRLRIGLDQGTEADGNGRLRMGSSEVITFCRVCEAMCGLVATVQDGKIIKIRGNTDSAHSRGHVCKKAWAMVEVTCDPDRVLYPMKRTGRPGQFSRISWRQAYTEIAAELQLIRKSHGQTSFATMYGNPPAFSYASLMALAHFNETMKVKWRYGVNADDSSAFQGACHLLFGSASLFPKPDIWRTKFLFVVGANPAVSHGSTISEPLLLRAMAGVVKRGGRVLVIDPRRTETARLFEHLPIRPGADAWFFAALLREILVRGHTDAAFIQQHTKNFLSLKTFMEGFTPEWASPHCGVPAEVIRRLADEIGAASREGGFAIHARTGTCTQRYGTLVNLLIHILLIVSGNLDRRGGMSFGWSLIKQGKALQRASIGRIHSRATGLPEVAGVLPSTALVWDILEPGEEQVRALMLVGGNPALSSAGCGEQMDTALQSLDLFFSIDIYVNETNRFAHYILPATTMFEREDYPLLGQALMLRPCLFATRAVVQPRGEAREEWRILDELCQYMGMGGAQPRKWMRGLARMGLRLQPRHFMDTMIRLSPMGDKFGFKPGGLSFDRLLRDHPSGLEVMRDLPVGIFEHEIVTADKRVDLAPPQLESELARLRQDRDYEDPAYPLRLVGLRELLSHNSWMHNVPSLMTGRRAYAARMHPADAAVRGIKDGAGILIQSPYGQVKTQVRLSEEMSPGTVALPHGWGHNGGWRVANASGGVNSNLLASGDPAHLEKICAMSVFNGIPIEVRPVEGDG